MNNENIGNIIKKIRQENNLSQQQFSDILGLNNSTISKWEHNLITPDITYLQIISDKFNIPIDKLLIGEIKAQKKPKKDLILTTLLAISLVTIFYLIISLYNYHQMSIYKISSSNKNLNINGTIIKHNKEIYLNLDNIEYNNKLQGTVNEFIPKSITLTVNKNNKVLINRYIENNEKESINRLLLNLDIKIKEKITKNDKILLKIYYDENQSSKVISTEILSITSYDYK